MCIVIEIIIRDNWCKLNNNEKLRWNTGPFQYKDIIWPVLDFPLWRWHLSTVLSPEWDFLYDTVSRHFVMKRGSVTGNIHWVKTENLHDANSVVTGDRLPQGVITTASVATSNDNVGIMKILVFMPILLSLATPDVVIMTIPGATMYQRQQSWQHDESTLVFQCFHLHQNFPRHTNDKGSRALGFGTVASHQRPTPRHGSWTNGT